MDQEPRKQGRPKTRQGDTNQERNYNSMKKLSAQGYFKDYYNSKKKIWFCDCCKKDILTSSLSRHQETKRCVRDAQLLLLYEYIKRNEQKEKI